MGVCGNGKICVQNRLDLHKKYFHSGFSIFEPGFVGSFSFPRMQAGLSPLKYGFSKLEQFLCRKKTC